MSIPIGSEQVFKRFRRDSKKLRTYLLDKFDHTCQSCGATDVPLELASLTPLREGGSNEVDSFTILCPNCHRVFDSFHPSELEFTLFLREILTSHPDFEDVIIEPSLGQPARYKADITATRSLGETTQLVLIESKNRSFFRPAQIKKAISEIQFYRSLQQFDSAILAFPGRISAEDRKVFEDASIEIWDLDYVARTFANEIRGMSPSSFTLLYSIATDCTEAEPSPEDQLLRRLDDCKTGKEDWVEYQKLIRDVFEFLFSPPLGKFEWESADVTGTNRRDIIFPNYTTEGFWKFLRESYRADFIVIDPKNYKKKISKAQVLQIANYLKPHGVGMFAIIVCREGGNAGCITTQREQWAVSRKLIVILNDEDIKAMLLASSSGGAPEDVIGQVIQEFRLSM